MAEDIQTDTPVESAGTVADRLAAEALIVDVAGFEGPLDLLLTLSRNQKVDLLKISVLQLAEQYLAFITTARDLRIELAADYLVMAAWMAYLKSRMLLPQEPGDDGPSADDMAAHLAWQLERLAAMRQASAELMERPQLGRDFFGRGEPEQILKRRDLTITTTLMDLMQAYARIRTRDEFRPWAFDRSNLYSLEQALERLRGVLGYQGDWFSLMDYLPEDWRADPARRRSATAAHFAASLEMAKQGLVELRQTETFGPLHLKVRNRE